MQAFIGATLLASKDAQPKRKPFAQENHAKFTRACTARGSLLGQLFKDRPSSESPGSFTIGFSIR
jgi:hypothetical protein